jgi:hypothetical protein
MGRQRPRRDRIHVCHVTQVGAQQRALASHRANLVRRIFRGLLRPVVMQQNIRARPREKQRALAPHAFGRSRHERGFSGEVHRPAAFALTRIFRPGPIISL